MAGECLAQIADITMGQSPSGDVVSEDPTGLPLLNGPTEFGPHHPVPVQFTTDTRKQASPGDILFCVRGSTTGRMNWADQEYAIGRGVAAIRHKNIPELQPLLRAVIEFELPSLLAQATGSTFPNVSLAQLAAIPFPDLPQSQQLAIANIFGSLDDKIEANRRMNETLEAMAQAIFKSWFVDFDPVRAKAEGRDPGLPKDIADLFPDRFQDSELGEIPKGWEIGVLDQLVDVMLGGDWGSDKRDAERSEAALCIRGTDIPNLQIGGTGKMPIRYLKPSSLAKRQINDGDLVVEISGGSPTQSTGRPVLISHELLDRLQLPLVCSNFCRFLKLKSSTASKFVYLWLRSLYDSDDLLQFENGTTGIKNLAFTLFSGAFKLCIPPASVLGAFDQLASPLFKQQQASAAESDTLANLRDALLPKLMSGAIKISSISRLPVGR